MLYDISFDPAKDLCATVPNMSCDITAAIESGVVVDTGVVGEFNNIDDPTSISCRIRNAFEAVDIQRKISAAAAAAVKVAPSEAPSGVSTPKASAE